MTCFIAINYIIISDVPSVIFISTGFKSELLGSINLVGLSNVSVSMKNEWLFICFLKELKLPKDPKTIRFFTQKLFYYSHIMKNI